MPLAPVHIVRTGTANLASVVAALTRAGVQPALTSDPAEIENAKAVILPGVGSFGAAMEGIRAARIEHVLRDRIIAGRPTLSICLGLQVLFESSEETPGVPGLGVVPGIIGRFSGGVRIPQLGWNRVEADPMCTLLAGGDAYYANSYRAMTPPPGFSCAWTTHGERFIAAMERGAVLACQFHPELSGRWGAELIERWLDRAGVERAASSAGLPGKESAPC
ncbi:MAG TPA: imidazole glycerol phosphate synthase subunit HisH [Phycisphaerales bacterium]|nr:imidazole glycerol phosphate synthase subunit HisH [Phycisphaerales bacterium]